MPCDAPACWADPVELVEVEDASMSLESLELVEEGLKCGRGGCAGVVGVDPGSFGGGAGWTCPEPILGGSSTL